MELSSLFSLLALFINITITLLLFFNKTRSYIINSYLLFSVFCSLYIFFEFLSYNYFSAEYALIGFKFEVLSWLPIGFLFLNFVNNVISRKVIFYKRISFFISGVIFFIGMYTPYIYDSVIKVRWGYVIVPGSMYFLLVFSMLVVPMAIGIKRVLKAYYSDHYSDIEKKTLKIILIGGIVSLVCALTSDVVLPHVFNKINFYRVGGICILFQSLSYFYIINRYYLSKLSVKETSMYLFQHSESPIILLNFLGNIQQVNRSAKKIFGLCYVDLLGKHISRIIVSNRYSYKKKLNQNICDVMILDDKKKCFVSQIQVGEGVQNGYLILLELA